MCGKSDRFLVTVTPVNDPPVATNLSAAETYIEGIAHGHLAVWNLFFECRKTIGDDFLWNRTDGGGFLLRHRRFGVYLHLHCKLRFIPLARRIAIQKTLCCDLQICALGQDKSVFPQPRQTRLHRPYYDQERRG